MGVSRTETPGFTEEAMILNVLLFTAGVVLLQFFPQLPPAFAVVALVLLGLLLWLTTAIRAPLLLILGFAWAYWQAAHWLDRRLPETLSGLDLVLTGQVADLPQSNGEGQRFVFDAYSVSAKGEQGETLDWRGKVRLWWRAPDAKLTAGRRLRLEARLFPPNGWLNPGGFDRERWLYVQGINATGYVRNGHDLDEGPGHESLFMRIQRVRQTLRDRIAQAQGPPSGEALLRALLIGDRGGLEDKHWAVFRTTGTSHLVAISGLHIGLIAGAALFLFSRLWRLSSRLCEWWPASKAAAAAALAVALGYAALAGFSVPTQRALVMLALAMGALMLGRNVAPAQVLAGALLAVLLVDTRAVLSAGTWLSFGAVAAILLLVSGRTRLSLLQGWWSLQWGLWIALLPVLTGWALPLSLIAPLINLLAVPWFTFVLVPLAFTPLVFFGWAEPVASGLLQLDLWLADLTFRALELASSAGQGTSWQPPSVSAWALGLGLAGVAVILAPLGLRYRMLGFMLLLPLALGPPRAVPENGLKLTVLDVGQGTSAVVMTPHHTLVYDLGPRFASGFNTAEAVVLPFLLDQGVRRVDRLILSHDDADHVGAWRAFIDLMPVDEVIAGQSGALSHPARACIDGEAWEWGSVKFELFQVSAFADVLSDNDASCVLRITHPGAYFLLTGDITDKAERLLLKHRPDWLPVDFVLVPHHGSRTSSSPAFVEAADADFALVSSGHGNRYGFPHPEVVERWRRSGAQVLDTASTGAQIVEVTSAGDVRLDRYRALARRYWHRH